MTESEILELAKQHYDYDFSVSAPRKRLIAFAQAVAAKTREERAVVCTEEALSPPSNSCNEYNEGRAMGLTVAAAAIRSMT